MAKSCCLKVWQHYLRLHKTKVYTDNVSLKYFETQTQVSAKQLPWHNTLALIDMELIHKPGPDNVVLDAISRWKEFQAISMTQTLRLMYKGEENLQRKLKKDLLMTLKYKGF